MGGSSASDMGSLVAVIINFFNSRRFLSFLGESPLNEDIFNEIDCVEASLFTVHGGYRPFCVLMRYSSTLFTSSSIFSRTTSIGR